MIHDEWFTRARGPVRCFACARLINPHIFLLTLYYSFNVGMICVDVWTVGLASARIIIIVVRRGAHTLTATSPHIVNFHVPLQG